MVGRNGRWCSPQEEVEESHHVAQHRYTQGSHATEPTAGAWHPGLTISVSPATQL